MPHAWEWRPSLSPRPAPWGCAPNIPEPLLWTTPHNHYRTNIAMPGCGRMEFRDSPSLAKGPISLPDLGWPCPLSSQPRDWPQFLRVPSVPPPFPFLLLTFHLPVLGGMEEGCPYRGSPGPQVCLHSPHTQHKQRASLCPSAAFTANAGLAPSPLPPARGPTSLGQGLMGAGAKLGS